jgi:nucleotide-binding universal stress UspA family protein
MKILIPVDGSEYTERAINFYLDHKQSLGKFGSATLLHVSAPLPRLIGASLPRDVVEKHHADEVGKAMSWARTRFAQYEASHAEQVELGEPAEKIADVAQKDGFELIIMGSRGHGSLPGVSLGSTALKVLGACKVPILIVR